MRRIRKWLPGILVRVVICVVILFAAVAVMLMLVKQRKPPAEAEIREPVIRVTAREAVLEDVPVMIEGTGEVRARDVVSIAPEVAGRVVYIHPRLEVGEVIPEGEVLFRVDPRDYEARLNDSKASVNLWESSVERLQKQYEIDRERLKTLERSAELAKAEYERVKRLFENDDVGTQSGVDQAERAWNAAADQRDQLAQQISLYPARIQEARSSLASAEAMAGLAEVNLERTEVVSPFNARVRQVNVEKDQYLRPGVDVLTLADDSLLEIPVGLNSTQARKWLRFGEPYDPIKRAEKAWFSDVESVPVDVHWIEGEEDVMWQGVLDRVQEFEPTTRTLRVVVQVEGEDAYSKGSNIPLVDGMFCRVRIPGRIAHDVVRVPKSAVTLPRGGIDEMTVYIARPAGGDGKQPAQYRLETVPVVESHLEGQVSFISEGIEEGDLVVTTRLVNPLENTLLDVEVEGATLTEAAP